MDDASYRLAKNREAARKSRQRRLQLVKELEEEVDKLSKDKRQLQQDISALQCTVNSIKQEIEDARVDEEMLQLQLEWLQKQQALKGCAPRKAKVAQVPVKVESLGKGLAPPMSSTAEPGLVPRAPSPTLPSSSVTRTSNGRPCLPATCPDPCPPRDTFAATTAPSQGLGTRHPAASKPVLCSYPSAPMRCGIPAASASTPRDPVDTDTAVQAHQTALPSCSVAAQHADIKAESHAWQDSMSFQQQPGPLPQPSGAGYMQDNMHFGGEGAMLRSSEGGSPIQDPSIALTDPSVFDDDALLLDDCDLSLFDDDMWVTPTLTLPPLSPFGAPPRPPQQLNRAPHEVGRGCCRGHWSPVVEPYVRPQELAKPQSEGQIAGGSGPWDKLESRTQAPQQQLERVELEGGREPCRDPWSPSQLMPWSQPSPTLGTAPGLQHFEGLTLV